MKTKEDHGKSPVLGARILHAYVPLHFSLSESASDVNHGSMTPDLRQLITSAAPVSPSPAPSSDYTSTVLPSLPRSSPLEPC